MEAPLWSWGANQLAQSIRTREHTCEEVVGSAVGRMRSLNPRLNAVVNDLGDRALDTARRFDAAIAAGVRPGPLFGVPVTIKENIDVEGQPTTNGLPALAGNIAPGDSAVVSNLQDAGAIIIGRTNTPELSMRLTTSNPLHGRTVNPWDAEASPGGSSGGAGASAAAGFGPIHHGNDIGGSLRAPAFCCGVATIKSTQGRVPAYNPSATVERGVLAQLMSAQGVIAPRVADVRLGTRVMAGPDPRDPWYVPVPFDGSPIDGPITVAVTTQGHGFPIDHRIVELIDRAAGHLSDAGYDVVEAEPPPIIEAFRGWFSTGLTELQLTLDETVRAHGSEELQEVFDDYYAMGELLDLAGYRAGFSDRTRMMREWNLFLVDHPLVLCPFLMRPAWGWNDDAAGRDAVEELFTASMYSSGLNFLGLPAGLVPVDLVASLPAGVQLVGRRFREDLVLDAMEAIERRAGLLIDRLWSAEQPPQRSGPAARPGS